MAEFAQDAFAIVANQDSQIMVEGGKALKGTASLIVEVFFFSFFSRNAKP